MRTKQRYLCKDCGLNFPNTPPRGKPLALKAAAVLPYVSGLSMNRTAQLLGVSTPTIQAWLEQFAAAYAQKPEPEGRAVVIELDEMGHYSGVRLTGRIAGFFEEVPAFVGAEQGADVAQGGPERLERARRRAAQERFDLGERHLDGVQIGRVLREEQEPGAPRLERLCGAGALVDREIVRDHDIAGPKGRGELGLDIGVERRTIHSAVHHPRGAEPVAPERSDEGLRAPAPERRRSTQALSAMAAPAQPRHLGVDRGLVDEHQACRLKPHAGLTPLDPLPSSLPDIGAG